MYPNYTKAFLNLEGVFIKKVVQADSFIKIFIQSQPVEQTCPCCGAKTKRIHDYRLQEVQDIPLLGKQVILLLRKRRYLCPYCRKRFTEPYSFLPSYHRRTRRLAFYIVSPAPADLFLKTDRKAYRCFRPDGLPPSGHDLLSSA